MKDAKTNKTIHNKNKHVFLKFYNFKRQIERRNESLQYIFSSIYYYQIKVRKKTTTTTTTIIITISTAPFQPSSENKA